jgi:zinc transport system substrate-binding protein
MEKDMSRAHERKGGLGCRYLAVLVCAGAILAAVGGCERKESQQPAAGTLGGAAKTAGQKLVVYTTFYPTTYFTQRIAGDTVEIVCPCPVDADPAFWRPDEQTVAAYQQADLIVVNGASFEKGLAKVTLPESRIVDTAKPLANDFIVLKDAVTHTHGPQGKHSHEGIDGHTWLDPINARIQAGEIKAALVTRLPDHAEAFEQGYAALVKDLDALDARLKALAPKLGDQVLLCSHPAYNYVGRRYAWNLKTYHLDPETMPDDETFAKIKSDLAEQPARFMLWESQPTEEIAARMSTELGLESIVYSPCEGLDSERLADGEDFLTVMNGNVDRLEQALGG